MTFETLGTRSSRRAEERERRRKRRRRMSFIGAGLALLLLVVITVVLVTSGGDGHKTVRAPVRTQRTVLLQLKAADGTAAASALLAHDPASQDGVVVLVPQQVLANVPGGGSLPFTRALQTAGVIGSRSALADLMGVTIDGSWVLDGATMAQLVDQLGGLRLTVDAPVVSGRSVLLQPGPQQLSGAQAVLFMTYLGPKEQEQTRLTRVQAVIDAVVSVLPAKVDTLLGSLAGGSESTLSTANLAALLEGLKSDDSANNLQYRALPVIPVAAGNDDIRFRIDAAADRSLVDDVLAQSIPPGSRTEGNRVLVLNGVGTPGLGQKVRDKLVPAGFVFVGSRNAPSFGYLTTQVLVAEGNTTGGELGARVAKALGLPGSSVQSSTQIGSIADVVVIVGKDFSGK